ncbi:hypothetical protein OKJ48_35990 [Streptomyces kunmingensis]|uniref:Tat pathway signal sequence domain protein n=1 Tax=Streptomyces kunmingensis TaxID=68225 RepID=A0ABU6CLR6_9ACTN|nr:hypothetical protein [Streptomyces kunmingensis]MEB3965592.1 hypothetical protein [Streptomyces kunmingensis]
MTGIGPVEPYDPADDAGPASRLDTLDTFGSDSPRLPERWAALPARWRRAAQALAAVLAAALAATAFLLLRPDPPASTLPLWPSQVTALRYDGPGPGFGRFRFTVHVTGAHPVTVRQLDTGPARLTTDSAPTLPVTVEPGTRWHLTVRLTLHTCDALPQGINEPYIELTLSNRRAQQRHLYLFGGAYRDDLWRWIRASCDPAPAPRTPVAAGPDDLTRK